MVVDLQTRIPCWEIADPDSIVHQRKGKIVYFESGIFKGYQMSHFSSVALFVREMFSLYVGLTVSVNYNLSRGLQLRTVLYQYFINKTVQ